MDCSCVAEKKLFLAPYGADSSREVFEVTEKTRNQSHMWLIYGPRVLGGLRLLGPFLFSAIWKIYTIFDKCSHCDQQMVPTIELGLNSQKPHY